MIVIKRVTVEIDDKKERVYSVPTVCQAIGKSENSIYAYFSNKGVSTKNGLTMDQIVEVIGARTRGNSIDWVGVKEIRKRLLDEYGLLVSEEEETEQGELIL